VTPRVRAAACDGTAGARRWWQWKQIPSRAGADLVALAALPTTSPPETPAGTAARLKRARCAVPDGPRRRRRARSAADSRGLGDDASIEIREALAGNALQPAGPRRSAPDRDLRGSHGNRVVREGAPGHVVTCHCSQTIPGDRTSVVILRGKPAWMARNGTSCSTSVHARCN
jgi:hypothetical protein